MSGSRATKRPTRKSSKPTRPPAPATKKTTPARHWTRGRSGIHRHGLFAACDIPRGTKVIEYIGPKLTKAEGWKRATDWMEKARGTARGSVYIFELNARWDIDGNVPWNTARLINHSCRPNCEPQIKRGRIWITAKRRIAAGQELTYDYGYDLEHWEEHPCRCGHDTCIGYIVAREHRAKLKRLVARAKAAKKPARAPATRPRASEERTKRRQAAA